MKVLVLTTVFPNPAQPYLGLFVRERIRHAARNGSVHVVAPVAWTKRLRGRAIPRIAVSDCLPVEHPTFVYVPGILKVIDGLLLFVSVLPLVIRLRRTFAFGVIDAHFGYPEGVAAVLLGRWFNCPVVVTLRGSELVMARSWMRRRLMSWALRRASRVVAVSEQLGRLAIDLGAPSDRVSTIRNGVDCARFTAAVDAADRDGLGVAPAEPLIVSVGHLVPGKGFHRLIKAVEAANRATRTPMTLAIVGGRSYGSGRYPTHLEKLAAASGTRVRFAGPQPPTEVARWLRAADLFVLASEREGCPNVVLEAMASGTPVVASLVGDVKAVVPEWAGVLYDPADPAGLEQALVDARARQWDRHRIRRYAETLTWTAVAERVREGWNAAAGSPSPVAAGLG